MVLFFIRSDYRGKFAYQRNLAIMNKKREERLKGPLLLLYRYRLRREGGRGRGALVSPFPPFSSFLSPLQKRRQKRKGGRGLTKTSAPSQTAAGLAKKEREPLANFASHPIFSAVKEGVSIVIKGDCLSP